MKNIYDLDWGSVTPEFYNREKNTAVYIFNHWLVDEGNVDRTIRFVLGRIEWYKQYLPQGCGYEIVFDDRGQKVTEALRDKIVNSLSKYTLDIKFKSKEK